MTLMITMAEIFSANYDDFMDISDNVIEVIVKQNRSTTVFFQRAGLSFMISPICPLAGCE